MKIIVDENMPYAKALFADIGEVTAVDGRTLTATQVADADVLLVRSVTQVNAQLLAQNQRIGFVGSATIGTDHIDLGYLAERNINFANAPGCNATAVGEYAFIAMLELAQRYGVNIKDKVVGIVGAGNTGSAFAHCLQAYGVKVLFNDPILALSRPDDFVSLDELIAQCDVVSLHVPLTLAGPFATHHLFDQARLESLKSGTWLFNCCRGEVIDNQALINVKQQGADIKLVLDVWEGEPQPMLELVKLAEIATPHIAGYSLEGKARGTFMLYQELMNYLCRPATQSLTALLPDFKYQQINLRHELMQYDLLQLARQVYDVRDDDYLFRQVGVNSNGFDQMRKNHRHRREFSALSLANVGQGNVNWLVSLGFNRADK